MPITAKMSPNKSLEPTLVTNARFVWCSSGAAQLSRWAFGIEGSTMKYHLLTAAFLIAAVLCYVVGLNSGVIVFAAAGLVLESVFWFRLFKRRRVGHA